MGIIREGLEQRGPELSPTWKSRLRGTYPASLQQRGWRCTAQGLSLPMGRFSSQAQTLLAAREVKQVDFCCRTRLLLADALCFGMGLQMEQGACPAVLVLRCVLWP